MTDELPPLPEMIRGLVVKYGISPQDRVDLVERISGYAIEQNAAAVAREREKLATWLDQDWPADAIEERTHRAYIAGAIRRG